MEADEDMLYDSDPSEGYYDDDMYPSDCDTDVNDDDDEDPEIDNDPSSCQPKIKPYIVLKEADIQQRQEDEISHVTAVLSLSKSEASLLLNHYSWDVLKLNDEWFSDEERVRASVGLLNSTIDLPDHVKELTCRICYDCLPIDEFYPAVCGHFFCRTCWKAYIASSINDGPGCLSLRCPEPSCRAAVSRDMVENLVSDEEKQKYSRYFCRSYIENTKSAIKWCPGPGCENAVEFGAGNSSGYDVNCLCLHAFCWNCKEDAHRPVDCETVGKWVLKNSSEAENTEWLIANSKPCPKCKRPIEKNHGCMHMTCTPPCKFEFCWLCLGDWSAHGEKTGGYYACNRYEAERQEGKHDKEEQRRKVASLSLNRYAHYYERWAGNQKSRQTAVEELHTVQTVRLKQISEKLKLAETNLYFIIEAWQQIIECRRVLTWSYAYGYYLPEDEHAKRRLFEQLQGDAETNLERLHSCVEKELSEDFLNEEKPKADERLHSCVEKELSEDFLNEEKPKADFGAYRTKLLGLTTVTCSFFENLVTALEDGLSEVKSCSSLQYRK